jgi:hypothetical protein
VNTWILCQLPGVSWLVQRRQVPSPIALALCHAPLLPTSVSAMMPGLFACEATGTLGPQACPRLALLNLPLACSPRTCATSALVSDTEHQQALVGTPSPLWTLGQGMAALLSAASFRVGPESSQ